VGRIGSGLRVSSQFSKF